MSRVISEKSSALISVAAVIIIVFGIQAAKVLLVPFLLAVFLALIGVQPEHRPHTDEYGRRDVSLSG